MFTTIEQVHEEFFKLFFKYQIKVSGEQKDIHFRYAKKSGIDYAEEQENQVYPCIVIQDYTPELKEEWFVDLKKYLGELSEDGLKGYLYQRPVWMEFRYDVSICAKSYFEYKALQQSFFNKFFTQERFILNKTDIENGGQVGDIVPYEVTATDIPRMDGVSETNYEFTLSVWLSPDNVEEVDIIKEVILKITEVAD